MPPRRRTSVDAPDGATRSPLVNAAERLVRRIDALVREVERLRADNAVLRQEVKEAVSLLSGAASSAQVPSENGRRRRTAEKAATPKRRRRKAARGRATPDSVTPDVVRAVLARFGPMTAGEVAQEITKAGATVSGRAVRFLAERAGAQAVVGEDGQRRYRVM